MKTLRIRGNNRQPRILLAARYADFLEIPFHSEREVPIPTNTRFGEAEPGGVANSMLVEGKAN